ncbi:MAG: hypothetical protein M9894_34260 [Planctomycetes bacterium]|nr:hypothetical protein [Planctomycetota bacterium]
MSQPELELALMKLLSMKHFPLKPPRPKLNVGKLAEALKRLGTETEVPPLFEALCTLKGRGLANTEPKIILKEEMTTALFEAWLTPLGSTELQKRLAGA